MYEGNLGERTGAGGMLDIHENNGQLALNIHTDHEWVRNAVGNADHRASLTEADRSQPCAHTFTAP